MTFTISFGEIWKILDVDSARQELKITAKFFQIELIHLGPLSPTMTLGSLNTLTMHLNIRVAVSIALMSLVVVMK